MSAASATATVRGLLAHLTGDNPARSTITGLSTPLGDTITATIVEHPITSAGHLDARLTVAEMNRGDDDADLAIVIDPSGVAGIDPAHAEAWNVHMTLPTLLRILGADTTTERTAP